jgi:hypothetical protein
MYCCNEIPCFGVARPCSATAGMAAGVRAVMSGFCRRLLLTACERMPVADGGLWGQFGTSLRPPGVRPTLPGRCGHCGNGEVGSLLAVLQLCLLLQGLFLQQSCRLLVLEAFQALARRVDHACSSCCRVTRGSMCVCCEVHVARCLPLIG